MVYYLRAETPGSYHILPGCVYPMYADKVRGETGAARLDIDPAERHQAVIPVSPRDRQAFTSSACR
jgi:hypothetical protein